MACPAGGQRIDGHSSQPPAAYLPGLVDEVCTEICLASLSEMRLAVGKIVGSGSVDASAESLHKAFAGLEFHISKNFGNNFISIVFHPVVLAPFRASL